MPFHTGSCYCEGVHFKINDDKPPAIAAYCHCTDCKKAHSAPIYQCVYVTADSFEITKGKELINEYTKNEGGTKRAFCTRCGTRIFNECEFFVGAKGTFPALLDDYSALPDSHKPSIHIMTKEAVLNTECIKDNLPKFESFPPPPPSE